MWFDKASRLIPPLVRVTEQGNPTDGSVGEFVSKYRPVLVFNVRVFRRAGRRVYAIFIFRAVVLELPLKSMRHYLPKLTLLEGATFAPPGGVIF